MALRLLRDVMPAARIAGARGRLPRIHMRKNRIAIATTLLGLALAGCGTAESPLPSVQSLREEVRPPPAPAATAQNIEPMLEAAGFVKLPADTPERQQKLASLEPLKLNYYVGKTGKLHYWFADPGTCHCLFHGDDQAYQRYEQMKAQNRFDVAASPQHRDSAETYQREQMDLQLEEFNPYGFSTTGPGIVF
jgi:hypothetical protein